MTKFDTKINGNTVDSSEYNPIVTEIKNIILAGGQGMSEVDAAQAAKSIANIVTAGRFFDVGGTANAITLAPQASSGSTSFPKPTAYFPGLSGYFKAAANNSGTVTINLDPLGARDAVLVGPNGSLIPLSADDIVEDNYYKFMVLGDQPTSKVAISPFSIASLFQSEGDIIVADADGLPRRLPIGSDGQVLKVLSGLPIWGDSSGVGVNLMTNGAFDVWQRGTSFATIADATYFADLFKYRKSGAMVHTASRSTDVPTIANAGILANYSALIDCTTVDASIAAGDYCYISQIIEGYNFRKIAQRTFTLSFWVKATKTGTYCVAFRNNAAATPDRSYIAEYTINVADTWEKKTITVTASPSGGTWNYTNGSGLEVAFILAAGSTYQTTAGAWQNGNYMATSNQVNGCDNTSNDFRIGLVQIESGNTATDFQQKSYAEELSDCKRCYEIYSGAGVCYATTSSAVSFYFQFEKEKRTGPTVLLLDQSIDIAYPGASSHSSSGSAITSSSVSVTGGQCAVNGFSGLTAQRVYATNQATSMYAFDCSQ